MDDRDDGDGLLAVASVLENTVNNTSVFFVLDVAGTSLPFPGDAQEGAWDHVLEDPQQRPWSAGWRSSRSPKTARGTPPGTGSSTPCLPDGRMAMLSWGLVERWKNTSPQKNLMAAVDAHHHTVIHADRPQAIPGQVTVHDDLWSEITFALP